MSGGGFFANGSGVRRLWALRLGLVLAAGLLLWRLGPFGTFAEVPAVPRLAYWTGLTLLQWLLSLTVLAALPAFSPWLARLALAAGLAALPTSFAVAWAEMLLRVQRDLGLADVMMIAGDVTLIGVPLLWLTHGWAAGRSSPAPRPEQVSGPPPLVQRLPPGLRGRLLALEAEDHYVRVHTDRGRHLLLMRFADAVAEAGEEGAQVHRGWWVGRGAAISERRSGDRLALVLADGTEVPVSRSFARAARTAGLVGSDGS